MKKLILTLSAFALLGTTAFAQDKDDKKAEMLKEQKAELVEQLVTMGIDKDKAGKFADCYVSELDKNLTTEELGEMKKLKEGEMPSSDIQQKMAKIGESCASALQ